MRPLYLKLAGSAVGAHAQAVALESIAEELSANAEAHAAGKRAVAADAAAAEADARAASEAAARAAAATAAAARKAKGEELNKWKTRSSLKRVGPPALSREVIGCSASRSS